MACAAAAEALRTLAGLRLLALSRWYETAPVPPSGQPWYINGVARLEGCAEPACLLAAIVVLTFMILPFFVTVATDSLRAVPRSYVDGGLALGMTRWRTIMRIQLPTAAPGLIAGLVLAAARGIGEAIAISMVAGAIAFMPNFAHGPLYMLLEPIRSMASAIVENGGEAMDVPSIAAALFGLATLLLAFSITLSMIARWAFGLFSRRMGVVSDRNL